MMTQETLRHSLVLPFHDREMMKVHDLAKTVDQRGNALLSVVQLSLSAETLELAHRLDRGEATPSCVQESLAKDLNELAQGPLLYEHVRVEGHVPANVQPLLAQASDDDELRRRLNVDFLRRALGRHINVQPYRGPHYFEQTDAFRFFGRRREGSEIVARVTAHEAVLVYAPSGAGKTSLLNARVIPELRSRGCDVLPRMRVQEAETGEVSLHRLRNIYMFHALSHGWRHDPEAQQRIPQRELPQLTFAEYIARRRPPVSQEEVPQLSVAFFDQFEELFTLYPEHWEQRADFFGQLRQALDQNHLLRILILMREDFLAEVDPYAATFRSNLRMRLRLEPLREEAALQAVVRPLERTQRRFDDGVAEQLVAKLLAVRGTVPGQALKAEFVEPVQLQVVCHKLWNDLEPDALQITKEHVDKLADVTAALSDFYDDCITKAIAGTNVKEGTVRSWFERELITPAGTRGLVLEGERETHGLSNEIVMRLGHMYLIRSEPRDRKRWYELTHDRLVYAIRDANGKYREREGIGNRAQYQPLVDKARQWSERGRPASGLFGDEELKFADQYLAVLVSLGIEPDESFRGCVDFSRDAQRERALAASHSELRKTRMRLAIASVLLLGLMVMTWRAWKLSTQLQEKNAHAQHRLAGRLISDGKLHIAANELARAQLLFLHAYNEENPAQRSEGDRTRLDLAWPRLPALAQAFLVPNLDSLSPSDDGAFLLAQMRSASLGGKGDLQLLSKVEPPANYGVTGMQIESVSSAAWQPRGHLFYTQSDSTRDRTTQLRVWDASESWRRQKPSAVSPPIQLPELARFVELSPDGKWLVAVTDQTLFAWELKRLDTENVSPHMKREHVQRITSVAVSATADADQARLVFSASEDRIEVGYLRGLNDARSQGLASVYLPLSVGVQAAAFDPTGRILAFAGSDGKVRLWLHEQELRDETLELYPEVSGVTRLVFSPDGTRLVAASDVGTAHVWDLRNDRYCFLPHGSRIFDVAFSADGMFLATAGRDRTAQLWRPMFGSPWAPQAAELLASPILQGGTVVKARFLPDGRHLFTATNASGAGDGSAAIWALPQDELYPRMKQIEGSLTRGGYRRVPGALILSMVASPSSAADGVGDGSLPDVPAESAGRDEPAEAEPVTSQETTFIACHADLKQRVAATYQVDASYAELSRSGQHWLAADRDRVVRIIDVASRQELARWSVGSTIQHAACSSINRLAITAHHQQGKLTIKFWNWGASQEVKAVSETMYQNETADFASFSSDGRLAVVATTVTGLLHGRARVYRLQPPVQGAENWQVKPLGTIEHEQTIEYADFNKDLSKVVTCSQYDDAKVTSILPASLGTTGSRTLRHTANVTFAVFASSPEAGEIVVTCADDRTARVWDAATGQPLSDELLHGDYVRHAAVSADGKLLATASLDQTASLWEIPTGRFVGLLRHNAPLHYVAFSDDQSSLVTVSSAHPTVQTGPATNAGVTPPSAKEQVRVRYWSLSAKPPLDPQPADYDDERLKSYLELLSARELKDDTLSNLDIQCTRDHWQSVKAHLKVTSTTRESVREHAFHWLERQEWFAAAWHFAKAKSLGADLAIEHQGTQAAADMDVAQLVNTLASKITEAKKERQLAASLEKARDEAAAKSHAKRMSQEEELDRLRKEVAQLRQLHDIRRSQQQERDIDAKQWKGYSAPSMPRGFIAR